MMMRQYTSRIKTFTLLLIAFSGWLAIEEVTAADTRPNILFFFADDWGKLAGFYSDQDAHQELQRLVRTPNMDAHAKSAVVFRNAFVNAPSCTPCRSSLLSGQYFWQTGSASILRGAVWNEELESWPLTLASTGYQIGKSFKVWSPGEPADAPYGRQQFAFEKAGRQFNQFSQVVSKKIADGVNIDLAKQQLLGQVRLNFENFLDASSSDAPFCYWFGPTNTHRLWEKGSGKKLWGIDPEDFKGKMPAFLPDVPEVRQDMADYFGEIAALDAAFAELKQVLQARGLADNTLIVISGDHGPPGFLRGKCNLYDFGTAVPLLISGPGIQGGRYCDELVSLVDIAPTLLDSANIASKPKLSGKSLMPVLLNKSSEDSFDREYVFAGRERHVDMARTGYLPYPQRSIRSKQYLLIKNFKPERYPMGDPFQLGEDEAVQVSDAEIAELTDRNLEFVTFTTLPDEDASPTKAWMVQHRNDPEYRSLYELAYGKRPQVELYNVIADPDQIHNLAGDQKYKDILNKMHDALIDELTRSGDPRLIDDGKYFETPPMAGTSAKKN